MSLGWTKLGKHLLLASLAIAAVLPPAFAAASTSSEVGPISCGNGVPGGVSCIPSKSELREARDAYTRGLKLQSRHRPAEAFDQFDRAARLVPQDPLFLSAREGLKAQLVFQHTQRGDALLDAAQPEQAAAEYRTALVLDPSNDNTQDRLAEAVRDPGAIALANMQAALADSTEIHLQPKADLATFHYRGDVRGMFSELAAAYGEKVQFDETVVARTIRFYVDDVDFFTALTLASRVSKTLWAPLDAHQFLVAADTVENHKQFDRLSLGTFSVPGATTPQEITETITLLRNICDFQKITTGQGGTFEVRAPRALLRACSDLVHQLTSNRPQVTIDVGVYQISHSMTRNIGVHIPNTFNLYNIPALALAGLAGQSISSLINQLIASGGINQAGSSALSGLLAQLQGQQNSIFSHPLATFGGGLTFEGLSLDQLMAALSLNESWSQTLDHITMRAAQGNEANFHLGERYPILNASYAPLANSPQISAVLGNQSYVAPFPSVSYEDLGLNLKAKPTIHANGDISMTLELQVRSLTGQSGNGVPVISNKEYKGSIRLRDGEPAVVAGEITENDQRSMSGIPGLGYVPGLNQALVNNTITKENDELLIMITPHIVANIDHATDEIWVSEK